MQTLQNVIIRIGPSLITDTQNSSFPNQNYNKNRNMEKEEGNTQPIYINTFTKEYYYPTANARQTLPCRIEDVLLFYQKGEPDPSNSVVEPWSLAGF